MIISASRRTDIPAFYADWLMQRVRAGFFHRVNPFNHRQVTGFSLKAEDVDAICFWSKNPQPLMRHLDELDERGLNYYFQFTVNPYGALFEAHVPPLDKRISTMIELAERIGAERVIWRYDPVILSSATPVSWHLEQVENMAGQLKNSTRRLVFSFLDLYEKDGKRLRSIMAETGITLSDITAPEQSTALLEIARGFKACAERNRMDIATCCEQTDLAGIGIPHGSCIDGALINRLSGSSATLTIDKNQRSGCNCVASVDMGAYNSCPFLCSYCYATSNETTCAINCRKHHPDSPSLIGRHEGVIEIRSSIKPLKKSGGKRQRTLF